jgi:hypothetical protein
MLFGVFEEHLKKMGQVMQMNAETVARNKSIFQKYYPSNGRMLQYYLLIMLKHLQQLGSRDIIYMLYDKSYRLPLKDIKKYREFEKDLAALIEAEMPKDKLLKDEKINLEREMVRFCIGETEQLMDCVSDEEITEKMCLLKSWCKFVTTEYDSTMIEIKWGERNDFGKYTKFVVEFLAQTTEDKILKVLG